jgi:hypothetical protein
MCRLRLTHMSGLYQNHAAHCRLQNFRIFFLQPYSLPKNMLCFLSKCSILKTRRGIVDKLNEKWLNHQLNFYFRYKRQLLESMIEGTCINIGCGSHLIKNAVNTDEGLPHLPYPDRSFDTVICSDVLEHIGDGHEDALSELNRIARKKVIITVPAYQWLYGKYDEMVGHKRRYYASGFRGYQVKHLFWFLIPILFLRKVFSLSHHLLPNIIDSLFFGLSKLHLNFGTTILLCKFIDTAQVNKEPKKAA